MVCNKEDKIRQRLLTQRIFPAENRIAGQTSLKIQLDTKEKRPQTELTLLTSNSSGCGHLLGPDQNGAPELVT